MRDAASRLPDSAVLSDSPGARLRGIALGAVVLLALALRAPIASMPLERDEGEYAYIAQQWLAGEVPYKGAFNQKPPGVFVAYALIQTLFGTSAAALHWGAQIYTLGTLGLLFALGLKLFSLPGAAAGAAFAALMLADSSVFGNAANTELFMILPMVGGFALALLSVQRGSLLLAALAGAASALAILFKQVAITNAAFHVVLLFALGQGARRWRLPLAFAAGGLVAALPVPLYFYAAGAWADFYDCVIGHNLAYSARLPLSFYIVTFQYRAARVLGTCGPVYALAAWGAFRAFLSDDAEQRRRLRLLLLWLLSSFLGAAIGGYFREHYVMQVIPAVALLAGVGAASVSRWRVIPCALVAAAVGYAVLQKPFYFLRGTPREKALALYGQNPFAESPEVARFIATLSKPDEKVLILGSEPQLLYHAQRKTATRYIIFYPLMLPGEDAERRQREVLDEIRKNDPAVIVTVFVPYSLFFTRHSPTLVFDAVKTRIDESYDLAGVVPVETRTLATGAAARAFWDARPGWYDDKTVWATMAVWKKKPQGSSPAAGTTVRPIAINPAGGRPRPA